MFLSPVGGVDVMRAQLHHVLQMSVRPYIHVRIMPLSVGAHAGMAGGFDLMRFDRIEPVIFLESENSHMVVERKDSVSDYESIIKSLHQTALDEEASRELITKLAARGLPRGGEQQLPPS